VQVNVGYTLSGNNVILRTVTDTTGGKIEETYTSATKYAMPSVVKTYTGAKVRTEKYTYDPLFGMVDTVTDDDGNVTDYDYDDYGRVTKITSPDYRAYIDESGTTAVLKVVQDITYTNNLRLSSPGYDISANVQLLARSVEASTIYYQGNTAVSQSAEYAIYDGFGNTVLSSTLDTVDGSAEWLSSNYTYIWQNMLEKTIDPLGNVTSYEYDSAGRVTKATDTYGNLSIAQYDLPRPSGYGSMTRGFFVPKEKLGQDDVYADSARESISESVTDIWGQTVETKAYKSYPGNFVNETYEYDLAGNMTRYTDAAGYDTLNVYDGRNRLYTASNAKKEVTRYTYDTNDNVTKMEMSANGKTWQTVDSSAYNELGQITGSTDALGKTAAYGYNNRGLLNAETDRNGVTTTHAYDEIGNITANTTLGAATGKGFRNQFATAFGASVTWDISYTKSGNSYTPTLYGTTARGFTPTGRPAARREDYNFNTEIGSVLCWFC
jgi:YD repeat-containing protein